MNRTRHFRREQIPVACSLVAALLGALIALSTDAWAQAQGEAPRRTKTFLTWLSECPLFASDPAPLPERKPDASTLPEQKPDAGTQPERIAGAAPQREHVDVGMEAQRESNPSPQPEDDTVFPHSQTSRFWLSGQANFIAEWHPRFHAQYSGPNSFEHASEQAVSRLLTLYTGFQLDETTELVVDAESSGWSGLSQALGLAGYTNLDVVRNPELSAEPYLARMWLRKVIPLGGETEPSERNPLSMLTSLPVRRLDIHVGKFSLVDFFDVNSVSGDSHMQFMNWTVDNNGAYDYAADTRGYTYGGIIEYRDRYWGARFGEALEPKAANAIDLEWNPQRAHSENYEIEFRPPIIPGRATAIRLLAFTNFANMGDYRDAIALFRAGQTQTPDITAHVKHVTMKYGFGVNAEQEITEQLRGFFRAGWNEGQHESFAYTEVDQTVAFGADLRGDYWRRPKDRFGVAFVANGISRQHREYLKLGGLGFLLGDGNLTYGPEKIMELYYNFPLPIYRGFFAGLNLQYIDDPGYNRDRGPVIVPGLRVHIEL